MKNSQGFGVSVGVGIIAVMVLIGGVVFVNNQNSDKAAMEAKMMEDKMKMEEDETAMKKDAEMVKPEGAAMDAAETGNSAVMKKTDGVMMEDSMVNDNPMMDDGSMMKKEESAMMQDKGTYTTYSVDTLAMAQKGKTVLFFHASWCPTCRTADADITAGMATIPDGVTILKTDYDKEVDLKQKYGVTTQHTFVEIDASGAMVQKWSGGNLAGIVAKL